MKRQLLVAKKHHKRVLELKAQATKCFLYLGKELKEIKSQRIYRDLGFATFEDYIASPELGFGRGTVYSLISIFEFFIEKRGFDIEEISKIEYSKLGRIARLVADDNVEPVRHREWLEKAKTLPRRQLEREVKAALTRPRTQ